MNKLKTALPNTQISYLLSQNLPKRQTKQRTLWDKPLVLTPVLFRRLNLPIPLQIQQKYRSTNRNRQIIPRTMLNYISQCYKRCQNDKQMKATQTYLKRKINQARGTGTLETVDWTKQQSLFDRKNIKESKPARKRSRSKQRQVKERFNSKQESEYLKSNAKAKESIRLQRFENEFLQKKKSETIQKGKKRKQRPGKASPSLSSDQEITQKKGKVQISSKNSQQFVGTSSNLQKQYLRITHQPDPSTVRPLHILKKSLQWVIQRYNCQKNYNWAGDQLRSIRQDMTIQHISNIFTVQVYQINAKLSLIHKDYAQFHQCQAVLDDLYQTGIVKEKSNRIMFISLQIYSLALTDQHYSLCRYLNQISPSDLSASEIKSALLFKSHLQQVVQVGELIDKEYHRITVIADPRMGAEYFCENVDMVTSHGQKISLTRLNEIMGGKSQQNLWMIEEYGGIVQNDELMLKESQEKFANCQALKRTKIVQLGQ